MTIGNLDTGYADSVVSVSRRPLLPAIRWSAVLAGVAVGVSVQLVLSLLGIASGLSAVDIEQRDYPGVGPLIWAGVSMLIAAFVGGYVAARMSGLKRKADGVLHGVVSWAVTTLLFATLATSAGGNILSGVFNGMAPNIASVGAGQSAPEVSYGGLLGMLKNQIGGNVDPATLEQLQQFIIAGQRDEAVQHMVRSMGVEQSRAETVVDQAMVLSGSAVQASPEGKGRAERALNAANTAAWAVFGAVALSLALSIAGGVLGAIGSRRTTWTDVATSSSHQPASRNPA